MCEQGEQVCVGKENGFAAEHFDDHAVTLADPGGGGGGEYVRERLDVRAKAQAAVPAGAAPCSLEHRAGIHVL